MRDVNKANFHTHPLTKAALRCQRLHLTRNILSTDAVDVHFHRPKRFLAALKRSWCWRSWVSVARIYNKFIADEYGYERRGKCRIRQNQYRKPTCRSDQCSRVRECDGLTEHAGHEIAGHAIDGPSDRA